MYSIITAGTEIQRIRIHNTCIILISNYSTIYEIKWEKQEKIYIYNFVFLNAWENKTIPVWVLKSDSMRRCCILKPPIILEKYIKSNICVCTSYMKMMLKLVYKNDVN